jgi:hypothetical protein
MTDHQLEELRVLAFSAMHLADSMAARAGRGDHVRGIDAEDAAYIAGRLGKIMGVAR